MARRDSLLHDGAMRKQPHSKIAAEAGRPRRLGLIISMAAVCLAGLRSVELIVSRRIQHVPTDLAILFGGQAAYWLAWAIVAALAAAVISRSRKELRSDWRRHLAMVVLVLACQPMVNWM